MNYKLNTMINREALENYLQGLYEAYEAFQIDYKRLHKRSKMHNTESVSAYYLRWRDKMRVEIRRIELVLMRMQTKPGLPVEKAKLNTEKNRLQNVA